MVNSDGDVVEIRQRKNACLDSSTLETDRLAAEPSFVLGSELENIEDCLLTSSKERKPAHITIADELTVFCDEEPLLPDISAPSTPTERDSSEPENFPKVGFFDYCLTELTRGYSLHNDRSRFTEKRRKVYTFFRIPIQVEQFLFYGQLQCIDSFCYLLTLLPIRFVMSILGFIFRVRTWTSAETCDVLKVGIMIFASYAMQHVDTSVVYHEVRSQGVIKLYIFYNMLEVADKLFSSLGQDILDALFWTANEPKTIKNFTWTIFHFLFAVGYATLHTFLVLLQATTLNVAFNSHSQALLAIMMSNNFVELKGSVFKKFAKANLFQMACSDVRERFHIMALLFVVVIRNMGAVNWSTEHFGDMLPDIFMVIGAELIVDWLKHAFITKFNEINAEVYRDFTITIAYDVVRSRDSGAYSDYSDQVSRRMGFIPIPLSIMLMRVLGQSFSFSSRLNILLCFLAWLVLLAVKFLNGIVLLGMACEHVTAYKDLQRRSEYDLYRKRMVEKKSKSAPSSPRMSLIDFSDVLHQPSGIKGFTVSDLMNHWEDLEQQNLQQTTERRSSERDREETRTPRRTHSMANLPSRARRDKSEPPPSIPEGEENPPKEEEREPSREESVSQISPKKKVAGSTSSAVDCEDLADVTAYTMLPPEQGVERIE